MSDAAVNAVAAGYSVKHIRPDGRTAFGICMQSSNGPCPLIAIANVLSFRGQLDLSEVNFVGHADLCALIAHILCEVHEHDTETNGIDTNREAIFGDIISQLPQLDVGLDVNVKFDKVSGFEYTRELDIFEFLKIPLVHGWLIDPEDKPTYECVSPLSYNQVVDRIIRSPESSDSETDREAVDRMRSFLSSSPTQLTYCGLTSLHEELKEETIAVFFRNNHFATMYKHNGHLYLLSTDVSFIEIPNLVWERLDQLDGDCEFVDANFNPTAFGEVEEKERALRRSSSQTMLRSTRRDAELALKLQRQEEKYARNYERSQRSYGDYRNASRKEKKQCRIM